MWIEINTNVSMLGESFKVTSYTEVWIEILAKGILGEKVAVSPPIRRCGLKFSALGVLEDEG